MRKEVVEFVAVVVLGVMCLWAAVSGDYYAAGACFLAAFVIGVDVVITAYRNMCK